MKTWVAIFSQSPANDGYYNEAILPDGHWQWPKDTWLQARREFLRRQGRSRAAIEKGI